MTKRTLIAIAMLLLSSTLKVSAQSRRLSAAKAKAAAQKTAKAKEEKLSQMMAATQKIVFIDSIVVDKADFLSTYTMSVDAGTVSKYDDFFGTNGHPDSYVYINELSDKCYFSLQDTTGNASLFTCDNFDGKWSVPVGLDGLGNDSTYKSLNFPFMMADGTTFYFAATGDESIGGYDIFVTRYDTESGSFLKAENIGMPFNSTANDYMYAIDEFNNLGWFATDRNQAEGKVCVYVFIPSDSRQLYSPDEYSTSQIENFAKLNRIADTWGDGKERAAAIERLRNLKTGIEIEKGSRLFEFVVNDKVTYTKYSDFRSPVSLGKFKQLQTLRDNEITLRKSLDKARSYYATANNNDRNFLKKEILQSEQQLESLSTQIKQLEKEIRNSENNF